MTAGTTEYRRAPGETTEWEDILHHHGIIEKQNPKVRVGGSTRESPASGLGCCGACALMPTLRTRACVWQPKSESEDEGEKVDFLEGKSAEELDLLEVRWRCLALLVTPRLTLSPTLTRVVAGCVADAHTG